jgi:phosphoribosylaminoimidazole-succinocarboxamide synthase
MIEGPSVREIHLRNYPQWKSGKVRDIFDAGDAWLFVATDRVSAFDVILPDAIPNKGVLLTQVSRFWFEQTRHIVPNHMVSFDLGALDIDDSERRQLEGRTMVVRKADRIDVECVVRSRLAGSGWDEYRRFGTLAGESLPEGLRPGDLLPELRFTPAIKNDRGHDENITVEAMRGLLGKNLAELLEVTSLALLQHAEGVADRAGFTIADTKFEFGFIDGHVALIDEVLTPDSSRYWDTRSLTPGEAPQGYDKQVIRNSLLDSGWNREPPAPKLPPDVIESAQRRYAEVASRLQTTQQQETGATT